MSQTDFQNYLNKSILTKNHFKLKFNLTFVYFFKIIETNFQEKSGYFICVDDNTI